MPFEFNHNPTPDVDGDPRRITSLQRFREKYDDPRLFPSSCSADDREALVLHAYVRAVRRFWVRRDRQLRPPLGLRVRHALYTVWLVLRAFDGHVPGEK